MLDLFYLARPVDRLTFDVAVAASANLSSPLSGLAATALAVRVGSNVVTLAEPSGTLREFTFQVTSADGRLSAPFTLRVLQANPSNDKSWSAEIKTRAGIVKVESAVERNSSVSGRRSHNRNPRASPDLSDLRAVAAASRSSSPIRVVHLASSDANCTATISVTVAAGASLSPVGSVHFVALGAAGSNNSFTFTVTAESGEADMPVTLMLSVDSAPAAAGSSGSTGDGGAQQRAVIIGVTLAVVIAAAALILAAVAYFRRRSRSTSPSRSNYHRHGESACDDVAMMTSAAADAERMRDALL